MLLTFEFFIPSPVYFTYRWELAGSRRMFLSIFLPLPDFPPLSGVYLFAYNHYLLVLSGIACGSIAAFFLYDSSLFLIACNTPCLLIPPFFVLVLSSTFFLSHLFFIVPL